MTASDIENIIQTAKKLQALQDEKPDSSILPTLKRSDISSTGCLLIKKKKEKKKICSSFIWGGTLQTKKNFFWCVIWFKVYLFHVNFRIFLIFDFFLVDYPELEVSQKFIDKNCRLTLCKQKTNGISYMRLFIPLGVYPSLSFQKVLSMNLLHFFLFFSFLFVFCTLKFVTIRNFSTKHLLGGGKQKWKDSNTSVIYLFHSALMQSFDFFDFFDLDCQIHIEKKNSIFPEHLRYYIPLYCTALSQIGAGDKDYRDMALAVETKTGGISASYSIDSHHTEVFFLNKKYFLLSFFHAFFFLTYDFFESQLIKKEYSFQVVH